jgi:hypothetical protein
MAMAFVAVCASAQTEQPPSTPAQHTHDQSMDAHGWSWMYEGVVFAGLNSQGGRRGLQQFRSQNWVMTMASRGVGPATLTLTGMFSAEPVTVRPEGYSEIFQVGEAYQGRENIDRQHPHDLFGQIAATVRWPAGISFTAAPVGEATLGPVVYLHRPSSSENPTAPLGHHTFDSTHISSSVLAMSVDRGPWIAEASVFHGKEPDEHRYDIEFGKLDSWAARIWFRPSPAWTAQISYGSLNEPERLSTGDLQRYTASVSWLRQSGSDFFAVTALGGHNTWTYRQPFTFRTDTTAFLTDVTWRKGMTSIYGRVEVLQLESEHLLFPSVVHRPHPNELIDWLGTYTAGGVRDFVRVSWLELGVGGDATFYSVPPRLRLTHDDHPVSYHLFVRVRPRSPGMPRMWDMTMTQPMRMR